VIGASNRPDQIDPAMLRGGRPSRTIILGPPEQARPPRAPAPEHSKDADRRRPARRERERQARERQTAERSPEDPGEEPGTHPIDPDSRAADPAGPDPEADAGRDDPRLGKPAPPGNIHIGGGLTGGS
jgi:hypothetical protein